MNALKGLPQRTVERVDRAVALAGRDVALALRVQLHRRLGDVLSAGTPFGDDPVRLQVEEPRPLAVDLLAEQQLERRLRRLEGVTRRLHRLDPLDDPADSLAVDLDVE